MGKKTRWRNNSLKGKRSRGTVWEKLKLSGSIEGVGNQ